MTVPSLFTICLDYIKNHSEDITSLDGVPYKPVVETILQHIFTSKATPLNSSILKVISESHSKALRQAQLRWTRIEHYAPSISILPMLTTTLHYFPKFITRLRIGETDLCDDDIHLLSGFVNLQVLDLQQNRNITDHAISYISTLATTNTTCEAGLPHLEELYLERVKRITDKSLKFLGKMSSLSYLSLTATRITPEVAIKYLSSKGFQGPALRVEKRFLPKPQKEKKSIYTNLKLNTFIHNLSGRLQTPTSNKRKPFQTIDSFSMSFRLPLDFTRCVTHATVRKNEEIPQQSIKKQRKNPTTDDFLGMVMKEMANDA